MLFDKGFLAMGNILFVSGVLLTIGLKPTVQFFTKPKNHKGSISFGFGFFLVLIGWPALGMMVESYGFIMLFSGFWPTAAVYLQKSPSFGWIFHHPFLTSLITRFRGRRVPVWFGWLLDRPQSISNRLYRSRPIDICILFVCYSLILPSLKRDEKEVVAAGMWILLRCCQ